MIDEPDLEQSAAAISTEIGVDLTYFAEPGEQNLIHIALPAGYVLLRWFLEGVIDGLGESAGEQAGNLVIRAGGKLGQGMRRVFKRRDRTPAADAALTAELAGETSAALADARAAVAKSSGDQVSRVADAYEQALVGYLTDEGMPGRDAMRIAQRLRTEAGIQLRLDPQPTA
jgi:hypothetical protein